MVKIEDILTDSGRATADVAVDVISQKPELFQEAYDLCMAQEGKMAMRAARVVWLVAEQIPELFQPYFEDMVHKLGGLNHSSVRRCMLKILTVYDFSDKEEMHGLIIEACFKYMNDPAEEVAIRGYSISVLERMQKMYPELTGELISALQIIVDHDTETLARYAGQRIKRLYKSIIP